MCDGALLPSGSDLLGAESLQQNLEMLRQLKGSGLGFRGLGFRVPCSDSS